MILPRNSTRLVSTCLLLAFAPAGAELLSTGEDTEAIADPVVAESVATSCSILWFWLGGSDSETDRLEALGYQIHKTDNESELALSNLLNYGTLVMAYIRPGFVPHRMPDIQAYVDQGGGLLIHQPNTAGTIDYAPVGFEVTVADPFWCELELFGARIIDASHPITATLTDADLSGAFDDVESLGPGYTVLADNPGCDNDPALAAGSSGLGRVVFDTGNGGLASVQPGTEEYWDALFQWLCTPGPISIEPETWGRLKTAYR